MRKVVVLSVLSLSLMTLSCKDNAANKVKNENLELAKERDKEIKIGGPKINFDNAEHDFGVINEGDVVETTFAFTNSGKSELVIYSAKGSCGCTIPEWPKEPVMPGEQGLIKVKFNSAGKPNLQQKKVTLLTNTAEGTEILTIKAQVTPKSQVQQNS